MTTNQAHEENIQELKNQISDLNSELSTMKDTLHKLLELNTSQSADTAHSKRQSHTDSPHNDKLKFDIHSENIHNTIENALNNQPATALSVAAGLGFLIGLMLRR